MEEKAGSQLIKALLKARGEFSPIKKDTENTFYKSKYATLASYLDATSEALRKNGLNVQQGLEPVADGYVLRTKILHESGEVLDCGVYPVNPTKPDPQGFGSAHTYARRYSYASALNLAPEDDDANEASKPEKPAIKAQDRPNPQGPTKKPGTVSEDERKRIFAVAKEQGHSKETVLAIVKQLFNVDSTADIPSDGLDALIGRMTGELQEEGK